MSKKMEKKLDTIRIVSQFLFLALFFLLFMNKTMQTWIIIFSVGVVLSTYGTVKIQHPFTQKLPLNTRMF